jgi:ABC-2 type transport system ATP-binding protein
MNADVHVRVEGGTTADAPSVAPSGGDVLVRVDGLERSFGDLAAVQGVSFEVRRGEVLGFLGPNGAGKSTTMQIIAGTLAPSGGQVRVGGVDILDEPRAAKARIGYLPEQPPLYRDLTVDEYLTYCARLHRIAGPERPAALARAKARCGLGDVGRRLIGNLSKGYQQRVGIAQAIVHAPSVVILDEPTVGLDPIQIREIRSLVRELGGDHSVILSTHILPEVQSVCDRVLIIHRGRLVLNERVDRLALGIAEPAVRVALRRPPAPAALAGLPGVVRVEAVEAGRFEIYHREGEDPTEALVAASVAGGWGLAELAPVARSLEEVFVQLTCGEDAQAPTSTPAARKEAA